MRTSRLILLATGLLFACEPTAPEGSETVDLTLRLQLAGGRDIGATPGRVYVFADSAPLPRAAAFPEDGEVCILATTPVTTCTFSVPRSGYISLIAAEPEPAVSVRFAPQSPQDTVRDGRYVEFTGWTECEQRTERGLCVVRTRGDVTIEANFQLMQQVSVYQTGAAAMDFITFAPGPTLRVPAQNDNILDLAGCRRLFNQPTLPRIPCDSIRAVEDSPFHRFSAFVPRQTVVAMFPTGGTGTEFYYWDGDCILSGIFAGGVCSLISPDTSGPAIQLTVRFSWWQCADGPADRDRGGCVLREPPPLALGRR